MAGLMSRVAQDSGLFMYAVYAKRPGEQERLVDGTLDPVKAWVKAQELAAAGWEAWVAVRQIF